MPNRMSKKVGRPSKITNEALSKLEQAYALGCSDREACFLAEVSPSALYRFQEKHPEFRERKTVLRQALSIKAKLAVVQALDRGDASMARWYLEHKDPEFKTKKSIAVTNTTEVTPVMTIDERKEAINRFMHSLKHGGKA